MKMTNLLFGVDLYESVNEEDSVAVDVIYPDDRQYFRISALGIGLSDTDSSAYFKIVGIDVI